MMTVNRHIFFRSLFWLVPRSMVLTVLLYFVPWVDWTPLPDLSVPLSYFYHLFVTYVFARLAFGRHIPAWTDAGLVSGVFILFGTMIEIAIVMWRTGAELSIVGLSYNWHSLGIILVYCLAVFAAAWRVRHKQRKELSVVVPNEIRSSEGVPPSSDQHPQGQA